MSARRQSRGVGKGRGAPVVGDDEPCPPVLGVDEGDRACADATRPDELVRTSPGSRSSTPSRPLAAAEDVTPLYILLLAVTAPTPCPT